MFAREGGYRDLVTVPVHLTLADGTTVKGHLERPRTRSLGEFLNGDEQFIEIARFDGSRALFNKQLITSCTIKDVPTSEHLKLAIMKTELYNPMAVLGLDPGVGREQIREAYMRLAKQYHPDRFVSMKLPEEVFDYIESMARRINLAYEEALEMVDAAKPKATAG